MLTAAPAAALMNFPSEPEKYTTVGSTTYFVADDGVHGTELWKTDGATTQMVRDLSLGDGYNPGTSFDELVAFDGKLYFTAYTQQADGETEEGLWKTDGTAAGTVKVRGSTPGEHFPFRPENLVAAGNRLQFEVSNILWQSNGTTGGTHPTRDLLSSQTYDDMYITPEYGMVAAGSTFYFVPSRAYVPGNGPYGYVNAGGELWKSNGTLGGTVRVKDIWPDDGDPYNHASMPRDLTVVNNLVFFTADDGVHGLALWKSDGTAAGTVKVKDLVPDGEYDSDTFHDFASVGGKLFFTFTDPSSGAWSLWSSDGTEAGTVMIKDLSNYSRNTDYFSSTRDNPLFVAVGNQAYFLLNPNFETSEVWASDGTSGGTRRVAEILPRTTDEIGSRYLRVGPLTKLDDRRVAYSVEYIGEYVPGVGNSYSHAVYVANGSSVTAVFERSDVFLQDALVAGNGNLYFNGASAQSTDTQLWAIRFPTGSYSEISSQPPANVAAGQTFGFSVLIRDIDGNPAASFNGPVTVAGGSRDAKLKGTLTVSAVGGVATFANLQFEKTGTFSLTVAAKGVAKSSTHPVSVAAGAPTSFKIVAQPPRTVVAGSSFGFSATLFDKFGNAATNYGGNVTASIARNVGGGTLGGTVTRAAQNGIVTFSDLTIDKAGNGYALQITGDGMKPLVTSGINVNPGTAKQLAFSTQPASNVTAGQNFKVVVTARDAFGNTATGFNGNVLVSLRDNPGVGTLAGRLTIRASRGVATFSDLKLIVAGSGYSLKADAPDGLSMLSNAFNVIAAAANKLRVVEQPTTVTAGAAFDVKVAVTDAFGNLVSSFNKGITVALAAAPQNGKLTGDALTVVPGAGNEALFKNLKLNPAGPGYKLKFFGSGLNTLTLESWTVT